MFRSARHNFMLDILGKLNAELLNEHQVFFGGGTALTMQLDEYRESFDLDFICTSRESFLFFRDLIRTAEDLSAISDGTIGLVRPARVDRDSIRVAVRSPFADAGMRLEIIYENRVPLSGTWISEIPVPVLDHISAFSTKLCANSDRWADRSTYSRDIIDIGAMLTCWPELVGQDGIIGFEHAVSAYGKSIFTDYDKAIQLFSENYAKSCTYLSIEESIARQILETLNSFPSCNFEDISGPSPS